MKWIEYLVAGLAGGALGFYGLTAISWQGSMVNMVFIATLSFGSNVPMMLIATFLGLIGGEISNSNLGAILAGALVPLGVAALPFLSYLAEASQARAKYKNLNQ